MQVMCSLAVLKSLRRHRLATFLLLPPCLFSACSKPPEKPQLYKMTGTVVSVELRSHQAIIQHGTIPGFMDAMTMPYSVKDDSELRKLSAGDQIAADLMVSKETGETWLSNVRVTKPGSNK